MSLFVLGINHTTAPVALREKFAFAPEHLTQAARSLAAVPGVAESALLSTCNRTELYCNLVDHAADNAVSGWLCTAHQLSAQELSPYLYRHTNQEAVRHIMRVAAGLDSMILGEPQILGQMKTAYQHAQHSGTLGAILRRLFQHTFAVAKQIRTETAIGHSAVSVAFAAVSLARQIFGDLNAYTAVLIGAGATIELAARHLHEQRIGRMIVANRTLARAHALAALFQGYAIPLDELPAHLSETDIIFTSTASSEFIVHEQDIKHAMRRRKHRPLLIVDLAVPRDVDPRVGKLEDVYLYGVDDLGDIIKENLQSRRAAAEQAEKIIDIETDAFMGWIRSLDAVATIRAYRQRAEMLRDDMLGKARARLARGENPDTVLDYLAHTLTNKLTHAPSVRLKQAGFDSRDALITAARDLFDLSNDAQASGDEPNRRHPLKP